MREGRFSTRGFLRFGGQFHFLSEICDSCLYDPVLAIIVLTVFRSPQTPSSALRPNLTFLDGHLDPQGSVWVFGSGVTGLHTPNTVSTPSKTGPPVSVFLVIFSYHFFPENSKSAGFDCFTLFWTVCNTLRTLLGPSRLAMQVSIGI